MVKRTQKERFRLIPRRVTGKPRVTKRRTRRSRYAKIRRNTKRRKGGARIFCCQGRPRKRRNQDEDGEKIEYTISRYDTSKDEEQFMIHSLKIPNENVHPLATNVFLVGENVRYRDPIVGDEVIKGLHCSDAVKTCELTKRASETGVGVQYVKYVIVQHRSIPQRVYLYTEYLPGIEKTHSLVDIQQFARKIIEQLKDGDNYGYHPDFWHKNICITPDRQLKAVDWDLNPRIDLVDRIESNESNGRLLKSKESIYDLMMERYKYMLNMIL